MEQLGPITDVVEAVRADLRSRDAVTRLWERDHTLFGPDPNEISDRLGWLEVAGAMATQSERLAVFSDSLAAEGITHAVVMGMGGSSLFPEVLARSYVPRAGHPELRVLDTTDPAAVARVTHECPGPETVFIASSKSGTTVETRSHLASFLEAVDDPSRFAVVTDPDTPLAEFAMEQRFRAVFENPADIGGRYSALSYFGLVPAAAAGLAWEALLARAGSAAGGLRDTDLTANLGARLGAILAGAVKAGRDKVTLVVDGEIESFGLWLEQLLAESTGKHGTGVIPVADERLGPPEVYGEDRLFVGIGEHHGLAPLAAAGHPVVELPYAEPADLGALVLTWEVATALCGAALGINPFDQPNVAEAKDATGRVLSEGLPDIPLSSAADHLAGVQPGDYVSIQAYVDPESGVVDAIEDARTAIRDRLRVATTLGLGPRFLHSTGQLHKGGPPSGVFLQVLEQEGDDVSIPGARFSFGDLERAQAAGDLLTLQKHGLRAVRVTLDDLVEQAR